MGVTIPGKEVMHHCWSEIEGLLLTVWRLHQLLRGLDGRQRFPHALWRDIESSDKASWEERGLLQRSNGPETVSGRKDQSWESNQLQTDYREAHKDVKGKGRQGLQGNPQKHDWARAEGPQLDMSQPQRQVREIAASGKEIVKRPACGFWGPHHSSLAPWDQVTSSSVSPSNTLER